MVLTEAVVRMEREQTLHKSAWPYLHYLTDQYVISLMLYPMPNNDLSDEKNGNL